MKIKESDNKMNKEAWNECESRSTLNKELHEALIFKSSDHWSFVDLDEPYWQNREDTIILFIPKHLQIGAGLGLMKFVGAFRPDEVEFQWVSNHQREGLWEGYAVRLWWD